MPFKSEKQRRFMWAQHPEIAQRWADEYGNKAERKQAAVPWRAVAENAGLAAAGAGLGHSVFPRLFGYNDSEPAKNIGTIMDAVSLPALVAFLRSNASAKLKGLSGVAFAAEQMLPKHFAGMDAAQSAAKAQAQATRDSGTIAQLQKALGSSTAKGVGAGLGIAGAGALAHSLARRRTDDEELKNTSRAGMFTRDFSRVALPVALAGGLAGSLIRPAPPA